MKDELEKALRLAEAKRKDLQAAVVQRGVALNALLVRALALEERRQRAQKAWFVHSPHFTPRPPTKGRPA